MKTLPDTLPESGLDERTVLETFGAAIETRSADLGAVDAMAHMNPPPPEIAVEITRLNARYNQNLLHPDLSPFATEAEARVIDWLSPFFGMMAGRMCGGSTLANLTALWCAREHGARSVVASADSHLSVRKSAHILGMGFETVRVDAVGRLDPAALPELDHAALVLTAGTTGRGAIDPLTASFVGEAAWVHVDAAWAGPMRLSRYAGRLDGIQRADSVAVSGHKWFFQPKDSALVLFADASSLDAIAFAGSYLTQPNVGVQGSRGAVGVTLLATLLAWGRAGVDARVSKCVQLAEALADRIGADDRFVLKQPPDTGVVNWRPREGVTDSFVDGLRRVASTFTIDGETWMRNVAANPNAGIDAVWQRIESALD